jgi:uncharacterized protein YjbI with pentapeptide repeats
LQQLFNKRWREGNKEVSEGKKKKDNVLGNIILNQVNKHIDSTTQQLISVGVNVMDDLTKRIGELYVAGKVEEANKLLDELNKERETAKEELSKKEAELANKEAELAKRGGKKEPKPVLTPEKGLELLKAGKIKEFNDARNAIWKTDEKGKAIKKDGKFILEGYKSINFSDADLSGLDLTEEIDIDGKKVRISANLSDCNLTGANLQNVNAPGVKFRDAILNNTVVAGANLHRADFAGTSVKGVDFTTVKTLPLTRDEAIQMLEEGKIREFNNRRYKTSVPLDLSGVKFENKQFCYDLGGGKVGGINLQHCILTNTKFIKCDMRNTNFLHAKVAGVDFTETKLFNAWIKGDVKKADFTNVNADNAHLKGTDFSGSIISGSSFKKADLSGVNFTDSKIENCNFEEANFTKAFMHKTHIKDCSFNGAILEGLKAPKAVLKGKIDLSNANLKDANLWTVDVSEAELVIEGNVQMSRGVKTEVEGKVKWEGGTLLPKGLDKEYAKELKAKFTVAEPEVKTPESAPKAFETAEVEEAYAEPKPGMEMTM